MSEREKTEAAALAGQRSNLYNLLALVYQQELTPDLLRRIRDPEISESLSDLGIVFDPDFMTSPEKELCDDLAVEYARLFLGPGPHISPNESVQHELEQGLWGCLWGDSTVKVKKMIEAAGLTYMPEFTGMPDHLSVELEFMAWLTRHEEQAWREEDPEEGERCLEIERQFIDEHLSRWAPVFCEKVEAAAGSSFYREVAALTRKFIEFEREEIRVKD